MIDDSGRKGSQNLPRAVRISGMMGRRAMPFVLGALVVSSLALAAGTGAASDSDDRAKLGGEGTVGMEGLALDFQYYRDNVEPIFIRPRGGFVAGEAACVACHNMELTRTPLLLQPLQYTEATGLFWTEEQSRLNFEAVARLVNPDEPEASRLLRKPLVEGAGGESYHTGGKYWESTEHVEYQTILQWIEMADPESLGSETLPEVDFEFFAQCVQRIFIEPIPGAVGCVECHGGGGATTGFARPPAGTYWTEAESERNFEVFQRLLEPGHPDKSLFLYKPLAVSAGGVLMHNGGRRWSTTDDPEWQMFAAWVRGERSGPDCTP